MRKLSRKVSALLLTAALTACGADDSDTTASSELAAPTSFKAEPLDGAAHLTWKDNSEEAEFMIERKSDTEAWKTIASVPFDTTQYHDPDLEPAVTYTYRVTAMSESGEHGPASSEVTCKPR